MSEVEGVPSMPSCFLKNCISGTVQLWGHLMLLLTMASDYLKVRKVSELLCFTPNMILMERVSLEALVSLSLQKQVEGSTVSCSWDDWGIVTQASVTSSWNHFAVFCTSR